MNSLIISMSYHEYCKKYIDIKDTIPAGEHHFVAIYLTWKIYLLKNLLPDYINPDGTKKLAGVLIYIKNKISFEIKLKSISFTKLQWYSWLNNTNVNEEIDIKDIISNTPTHFIGAYKYGLIIIEWNRFKHLYNQYMSTKLKNIPNDLKNRMYTPSICVEKFIVINGDNLKKNIDYILFDKEKYVNLEFYIEKAIEKVFA